MITMVEVEEIEERLESLRLEYLRDRAAGRELEAEEKALLVHRFAQSVGERTPHWAKRHALELAGLKRWIIERYASRFCRTGNVMYAWGAFVEARSIGNLPPEWVLLYIEKSARALRRNLLNNDSTRPHVAFLEAFGIRPPTNEKRKSGRGTMWTRFRADQQRLRFGQEVARFLGKLSKGGKRIKIATAIDAARQSYNNRLHTISFPQALRAWKYYKHECSEEASQIVEQYRDAR
jgi:hypothetical protein